MYKRVIIVEFNESGKEKVAEGVVFVEVNGK